MSKIAEKYLQVMTRIQYFCCKCGGLFNYTYEESQAKGRPRVTCDECRKIARNKSVAFYQKHYYKAKRSAHTISILTKRIEKLTNELKKVQAKLKEAKDYKELWESMPHRKGNGS